MLLDQKEENSKYESCGEELRISKYSLMSPPSPLQARETSGNTVIIDTIHMDRKLPTMCGGSCVLHWKLHPQSSHGSITCIKLELINILSLTYKLIYVSIMFTQYT